MKNRYFMQQQKRSRIFHFCLLPKCHVQRLEADFIQVVRFSLALIFLLPNIIEVRTNFVFLCI